MLYALICIDKPDSFAVRQANRADHLAYIASLGDRLVLAGPFTDEAGEIMTGSLIVIEAPSIEAVREIAANDPYAKAGLFANVDIRPWRWSINNPAQVK